MSAEGPPPARGSDPAPREGRRRPPQARREAPTFLSMIGVVALVVAAVIVVFFVFGYILGRLFL